MNGERRRTGELIATLDPKDTNVYGNIFGGVIMSLMDKAAAVAAWRYARMRVLTASASEITFLSPIRVGEVVRAAATVVHVGQTSMDTEVLVEAENVVTGDVRPAASGYFTMVAVDDEWRPAPLPPWRPETEEDCRKWEAAEERRRERKRRSGKRPAER
jgi:acyl-CoA thioesterase YciA